MALVFKTVGNIFNKRTSQLVTAMSPKASTSGTKAVLKELSCDVFTPSGTTQQVIIEKTKDFWAKAVRPFVDWSTEIPKDNMHGSELIGKQIDELCQLYSKAEPETIKHSLRLLFGTTQVDTLERATKVNSSVKKLMGQIETSTGKTLRQIIEKSE